MSAGQQRWQVAGAYAAVGLLALAGIALSGMLLQSSHSLYLAFDRSVFLQQGWALLLAAAGVGLIGALLDGPGRARLAVLARVLLLGLVAVGCFQVLRRSLAPGFAFTTLTKLGMLGLVIGLSALAAWRLPRESFWRAAKAGCLVQLAAFAMQPGALSYLAASLPAWSTQPTAGSAATQAPAQRVIVVVLDEWDYELALREGMFEQAALQPLLASGLLASQARPAGPNTLVSLPALLLGRRFGPVDHGGTGYLVTKSGERLDGSTATLFNDAASLGVRSGVVGFFHDYCRLLPTASTCVAEPVRFFPGWSRALMRAFKSGSDLNSVFSDFMQQWRSSFEHLRSASLELVDRNDLGLVLLHLNVPHPPLLSADSTGPRSLGTDYANNLRLAADFMTAVAQRVVQTKVPTVLVYTSDHWLREKQLWGAMYDSQLGLGAGKAGKSSDQRIPLLISFLNQASATDGLRYDKPLSTTVLRSLTPELLSGRLRSPAALASWLDQQPSLGDVSDFADRKSVV